MVGRDSRSSALRFAAGTHDVDLVGTFGKLREDSDAVWLDFSEATRQRHIGRLRTPAEPEFARAKQRQQRRVTREDAEVTVSPGDLHFVHPQFVHE